MKDDDKKVRCKSVSLQYSCYNVEELCITIRRSYKRLSAPNIIIIAFVISLGIPDASSICSIFDRPMESNAFEKSTKMITAGSCFCFCQHM